MLSPFQRSLKATSRDGQKGVKTMAIKLEKKSTFLKKTQLHDLAFEIQTKILMETVLCPHLLSDDLHSMCQQLTRQVETENWTDMLNTLTSLETWLESDEVVLQFDKYNEPDERSDTGIIRGKMEILTAEIKKRKV